MRNNTGNQTSERKNKITKNGFSIRGKRVISFYHCIEDKEYGSAWNCLVPRTKQFYRIPKAFKLYQTGVEKYLLENIPTLLETEFNANSSIYESFRIFISQYFEVLNIKLSYPLENVCFTKFDLSVEQRRSFWKRTNNKFVLICA